MYLFMLIVVFACGGCGGGMCLEYVFIPPLFELLVFKLSGYLFPMLFYMKLISLDRIFSSITFLGLDFCINIV